MELPEIGQQCTEPNCKQLDFLPLKCECGQLFCSQHFNEHVKVCQAFLRAENDPKTFQNTYKCSEKDCTATSLLPIICARCKRNFCIKHRHLAECRPKSQAELAEEKERYAAPVRQFNAAKEAVDKTIESGLKKAKSGKNAAFANKLQLIKIKAKATGLKTIPVADRVYFSVTESGTERAYPVFVSGGWSVGRAIDAIANECQLKNENNTANGAKLRLFRASDGAIISANVADSVQFLLEKGALVDGDSLLAGYVEEGVHFLNRN